MRTYDLVVSISLVGLALGLSPAASFDGTTTPGTAAVAVPAPNQANPLTSAPAAPNLGRATPLAAVPVAPLLGANPRKAPLEALRSGTQALRAGKTDQALSSLEYAAEQGVPGALWKLGRMYADGDGVAKDRSRAFDYFRRLTNLYADDLPGTPQARFVANAFVTLGHYYLEGIPEAALKADPNRAREMYRYAASYFGDPDAQYNLGRLYLLGEGAPKDPIQAARWLRLAAIKGQHNAQAMLGTMLFNGVDVSRQGALGLFWLIIAKDGASPDEGWINDNYTAAFAKASEDERAMALRYLENWLKSRR